MPLWLLLFLVIPIAIWLKINKSDPWIVYSESRADFIESDFEVLDFNFDPTGKPLNNKQAVDTLFQTKEVTFSNGGFVGDRAKLSSPFAELDTRATFARSPLRFLPQQPLPKETSRPTVMNPWTPAQTQHIHLDSSGFRDTS